MTYDLAKKLKNAGFPQVGEGKKWCKPQWEAMQRSEFVSCGCDHKTEEVYFPTLSELIEACGKHFHCLVHTTNGGMDCDREFWSAGKSAEVLDWLNGSTPEEAVANLWLAINKK